MSIGLDKVDVLHDVAISPGGPTAELGDCCAYPVTDRTPDGLLACIYRCGAETYTYDGIPVARTSRDRGTTWSDPIVLFDGRSLDPPHSVINPQVVAVPDGYLLALFQAVVAIRPDEDPFTSVEGFLDEARLRVRAAHRNLMEDELTRESMGMVFVAEK